MRKIWIFTLLLMATLLLAACGATNSSPNNSGTAASEGNSAKPGQSLVMPSAQAKENTGNDAVSIKKNKVLVAYFSRSGNTREIANQIQAKVSGDIFEIVTVNPYPSDYNATTKQAKQELESGYRPELRAKVNNIEEYDVIFLGYPNWWGTIPMPVASFLSQYNLAGKTIIPFCTHQGSGLGRSVDDIRKLSTQSTILEGISIRGSDTKSAQNDVIAWLRKLNVAE